MDSVGNASLLNCKTMNEDRPWKVNRRSIGLFLRFGQVELTLTLLEPILQLRS